MLPPELTTKLNECSNTNFVGIRDHWFFLQSIFSWAVIAGLVLEGPELWYEMLSIVRSRIKRFRYRIVLIESRLELAKIAAFVGWIFIVGGLFGELRASSKIVDFSARIQECSDAKVREVTIEAGDAQKSAERAEASAEAIDKYVDEIAKHEWPRELDGKKFVSLLGGKPRSRVAIMYSPSDPEAWAFARDIYWWLGDGLPNEKGAGWHVSPPESIPNGFGENGHSFPNSPSAMNFAGAFDKFGITLVTKHPCKIGQPLFAAGDALGSAIVMSVLPEERGGAFSWQSDSSIAEGDVIVIVVGPKSPRWHPVKPASAPKISNNGKP